MAGMTPGQIDDFNARRAKRIVSGRYAADRQQAMDEQAAMPLDAESFWSEAGRALGWGAASAVDETIETGRQASAEVADEPAMQRIEARAAEVGESLGVEAQPQPDRQQEVTMLRDGFGLQPPSTMGGQMAASAVQAVTGAAAMWWMGPAVGTGKAAAAAGKAVEKVAPKLAGSATAQAAGKGAVEGQVAFGASAFAAFDGQEQSMLVALNENPAFERFVWDMLASPDPDAGEWENRFRRMAEEGVFGGIAGGALGAMWQGTKHFVKAKATGSPGNVLDGPAKPSIRAAQQEHAVSEASMMEQQMLAADDDFMTEEDLLDFEAQAGAAPEGVAQHDVAPRMPGLYKQVGEDEFDPVDVVAGQQMDRDVQYFVENDAGELEEVGEDLLRFIETSGEEFAPTMEASEAAAARTGPMKFDARGPQLRNPVDLAMRELLPLNRIEARERDYASGARTADVDSTARLDAALWGASTETGLREVAGPALRAAEQHAGNALRDAAVDPTNTARAVRAEQAAQAWRRTFASEWAQARAKGWRPGKLEGEASTWKTAQDGNHWMQMQKQGMRDVGRLNPDLDPVASSSVVASVRAQGVSEVQAARPQDWGDYSEDTVLARQRPEAMDSVLLKEETRRMLRVSGQDAAERPVDLHFVEINTPDDAAMAYNVIAEARNADLGVDHTVPIDKLRRTFDNETAALREAGEAFEAMPKGTREEKKARADAAKQLKAMRETHKATGDELDALRTEQAAITAAEGDAKTTLEALLDRNGYGRAIPGTRRLREDVDPRIGLHMVESAMGSLQRLAQGAASDAVSSTQRAAAVRALHTTDGLMKWLTGDDKGAGEAFRRADLPAEEGSLMRPSREGELPEGAQVVQRRLGDMRLVAQSGGTQRVQAQMAGMALAKDGEQMLHHLHKWREDARYAWSAGQRMGLHNLPRAVMQVRMAGMLSRLGTASMNLTSNAVFGAWRVGERFLSEAYDVKARGVAGALSNAAAEASDMAMGISQGSLDGWQLLKADAEIMWKGNQAHASVMEKLDEQNLKRVYEDADSLDQFESFARTSVVGLPEVVRDMAADTRLAGAADFANSSLDWGLTYGTKVAKLGDMWFKGVNRRMELHRLAGKQVRARLGERTQENAPAWDMAVERLLKDPPEEMERQAMEYAHVSTFTNESLDTVEQYIELMSRYPALRTITPYVRTPANVAVQGIMRTPLVNMLLKSERQAFRAGGEARRDLLARQTMGTMGVSIIGAGGMMAGLVSGSEPRNDQVARAWRASGKKAHSVKVGGAWVDYSQIFGPYAPAMVAGADAMEAMMAAETAEEFDAANAMVGVAANLGGFLIDQFFVDGYVELFQHMGPDTTPEQIGSYLRRMGESFGPNSAIMRAKVRQFRDAGYVVEHRTAGGMGGTDEELLEKVGEEWKTFRDTMVDRYFGFLGSGADRTPKRDHRGRPVSYQSGGPALGPVDLVLGFAGPAAYSYEATDPLAVAEREVEYTPGWPSRTRLEEYGRNSGISRTIEYSRVEADWLAYHAGRRYERAATALIQSAQWRGATVGVRREMLAMAQARARTETRRDMDRMRAEGKWQDLSRRIDEAHRIMDVEYKQGGR